MTFIPPFIPAFMPPFIPFIFIGFFVGALVGLRVGTGMTGPVTGLVGTEGAGTIGSRKLGDWVKGAKGANGTTGVLAIGAPWELPGTTKAAIKMAKMKWWE